MNTGIVTFENYGTTVPSRVSHITFTHEVGHNFGSPVSEAGRILLFKGEPRLHAQFQLSSVYDLAIALDMHSHTHTHLNFVKVAGYDGTVRHLLVFMFNCDESR